MQALRDGDPTSLGGYTLLGRLGAGSMGVVYLGQDERGHPVAVKAVATTITADETYRARFRREVELALRVSSPYTARVLAADTQASRPYMVTEYVAGETLRDRISRAGAIADDQVLAIAAGLAAGMAAIHAAGVTHRDLSAGNVILATDGPRIVDLGVGHFEGATQLTQAGTSWGTPAFMSPEHATGQRVGAASDVFSWGSLIVFAATGHAAFGQGRPEQLMYRIVHEPPRLAGVPQDLKPLVEAALRKDPDARPTGAELADSTGRLLGSDAGATVPVATLISQTWHADAPATEPVWAEKTTPVTASPSSSRRGLTAAGIFVVAAVLALAAWSNERQPSASPAPDPTAAATEPTTTSDAVTTSSPETTPPVVREPAASTSAAVAPTPTPPVTESSAPNASPSVAERPSPTETAPGRPELPAAPWNTSPVQPSGHVQEVANAFYSKFAEWEGCTLYAPTEVETGLQASPSDWSPLWTRFGFFTFEWAYPDDGSAASTVFVYPPDSQAVTEFFDADPDGTTFADGSVLRLGGEDGLTHLLAIPGEDCFYAFQWYSMVGLSYVETIRPIAPPTDTERASADQAPQELGSDDPSGFGEVPDRAMEEVEAATGEEWWIIQEHWDQDSTLNAAVAAPAGSATGRGRHVFFFVADRGYIGRDLSDPSEASQIAWSTSDTIAVEYTLYREGDAGCCPTGGSSTVHFQWTGDELMPLDPIPPLEGPIHR